VSIDTVAVAAAVSAAVRRGDAHRRGCSSRLSSQSQSQ
jgi:hypothetical protein